MLYVSIYLAGFLLTNKKEYKMKLKGTIFKGLAQKCTGHTIYGENHILGHLWVLTTSKIKA
jgi:hypothetical protein